LAVSIIEKYSLILPVDLRGAVSNSWQTYENRCSDLNIDPVEDDHVLAILVKVWCCSQFVTSWCIGHPDLFRELVLSGDLFSKDLRSCFLSTLKSRIERLQMESDVIAEIRQFRNRQLVRIAIRDIGGLADLSETMGDLTAIAEASLQVAHDYLFVQCCKGKGTPKLSGGQPQRMVILGMGKLGAWELNFSSDIDLIFAYPEDGVLPGQKETSYSEFFNWMGQKLIELIDRVTEDGFVFRVDMRLRPFGKSGPLVMSFDAMENYYQAHAREWERYAMIKARPIAGDMAAGKRLQSMFQPFVYRRYLDYGAFSRLRELKAKITRELRKSESYDDIKLGFGGIREIEFIGQAFQLIRGGRDRDLQERRILKVLEVLGKRSLLPNFVIERLTAAYEFLRIVENRLQQYADQQTHTLPSESEQQAILAFSLGFESWELFKIRLDTVRDHVHGVFEQVFESPQTTSHESMAEWIWATERYDQKLLEGLKSLGYRDPDKVMDLVKVCRNSYAIRQLPEKGADTLDTLMPMVLAAVGRMENAEDALNRMLSLIETVASRRIYLCLLVENPVALSQLVKLASASSWIMNYIARFPLLLDELLDPRTLLVPLAKKDLEKELSRRLEMIECDDLEQQMAELRHFKQAQVLKVAAADIMGAISLPEVSNYLTEIAQVVLSQSLLLVWRKLSTKYGVPRGGRMDEVSQFGIIGYGKLGGFELGYGSDLDLVFLYDIENMDSFTNGPKPIPCVQFFVRLGQRLINFLNTNIFAGVLYEIDMRLRPSGNSGLLVSPIEGYADYLANEAWVWEHQALVRARFVAGDSTLEKRFQQVRSGILCRQRTKDDLSREVTQMRRKMRQTLILRDKQSFDLKQGIGGIVDIEFIVQFCVLNNAIFREELIAFTDNLRLLEGLHSARILNQREVNTLTRAYRKYRDLSHRLALKNRKAAISKAELGDYPEQVRRIWDKLLVPQSTENQ